MKRFFHQVLSLLSRAFNVLIGGDANYTTSAVTYRNAMLKGGPWRTFLRAIDAVLGENHCKMVWEGRLARAKATIYHSELINALGKGSE